VFPLKYFPAGQGVLQKVAPAADTWPAGHAVQEAAPAVAEKVFAGQSVHAPPAIEVLPAGQFVQSALDLERLGELLPAGQLKQVTLRVGLCE
jgi:hypothetical protein